MKEGWRMVKLGKIVKLIADGDWIESKDQSHEGIRLIQTGNIGVGFFKDKSDSCRYISESTFNKLKCTEIFEGDCLVSRLPDPVGRACIIPCTNTRMITAVDCSILRFDNSVLPGWFVFYSQSKEYFNKVNKESTGSTRKRISRKNLSQIEIPLPPLEEQHRIVSILDASFEKIDALKKNAEENLKNAKALFQQVLAQELKPKEGWVEKKLGEIYDVRDGTHDSPKYHSDGYPFVTSKNLVNGIIDMNNVQFISKEDYDKINERSKVDKGDVLFAMIGSNLGHPAIVDFEPHFAIKNVALFKVPSNQLNRYLLYLLSSDMIMDRMNKNSNGSSQPFVSLKFLRNFEISLPSLSEQHRIVATLETLSEKCRRLEEVAQQTIRKCDALKQSILRQAFSGEL